MVFCYPAYLEPAGLTTKDAILLEDKEASKHYALQVVTRKGEKIAKNQGFKRSDDNKRSC